MEQFIKELQELMKKHKIHLIGLNRNYQCIYVAGKHEYRTYIEITPNNVVEYDDGFFD